MSAKNGSIKLVAGNSNPALAQEIADWLHLPLTKAIVRRFADMEIFVEIQENVRGSDVFIIQSTSFPANDHLMELLIITDALRRASARRITAVIPYFGYARQDRKSGSRTPISAKLVANLITHAGVDRVMTLDLHAGQIQGFFDIPTDNLFASPVMVRDIKERFDLGNVMVVSPDVGGVVRARGLAKRINAPLAIIDKRRERAGESEVMNVIGDVAGYTCILVDDIVDSGGTLVNAADALLANGAKDVYAYITHGVLSGGAAARITASRLKELVITDSILPTEAVRNAPNIRTLSIAPADRRSHRPHRVGRVGVEPVRLATSRRAAISTSSASAGTHTPRPFVGQDGGWLRINGVLWLWVPAFALEHAHIFESLSYGDGVEVFEAVFEGDGTWRFGRWIAVPTAEAADDPGGPGKAVGWMRVPETLALGLEILVEGGERCDLTGIEGKADGLMAVSVARLQELDGDDRSLGGDRDQLEQPVGGGDLAVFQLQTLGLEDAEELLDQPAPLVPFDDAPGLLCRGHGVCGEKPPVQRLGAGLRIGFTDIDQVQRQTFRQMTQELGLRPGQFHRAEAQFKDCDTFGPRRSRRQHDGALIHHRHPLAGRIQADAVGEFAIMHAAGDDVEALLGRAGIKGEDVALTVAECGYHGGLGKQRLGRQRRGDPALRFLVRQVAQIMRDGAAALAGPDLAAQQAETAAILGVHRQHRVQQHPAAVTLADLPKPTPAFGRGCEVDFAGILDRQYVAAFGRRHRAFAPAFDHPCDRHLGIAEKAVEPHFLGTDPSGQPPQADILARDHAFDERRPLLSRRRSPNRPNDQSICASMPTPPPKPKCRNRNHMNSRLWNPLHHTRVNPSHQMCACPSAFAGTTFVKMSNSCSPGEAKRNPRSTRDPDFASLHRQRRQAPHFAISPQGFRARFAI